MILQSIIEYNYTRFLFFFFIVKFNHIQIEYGSFRVKYISLIPEYKNIIQLSATGVLFSFSIDTAIVTRHVTIALPVIAK